MEININRAKAIQKWRPILESVFDDIRYLMPFIESEISYQLELKTHIRVTGICNGISINDDMDYSVRNKLPEFVKNIHTYLIENIPIVYLEDVKISVNPMNGDILYKYKDNFLDIKSLQKQRIEYFLIEIDFNNVIDKLYNSNPKKYIRKVKLNKIKLIYTNL
jgi:hypothetical protein